MIKITSHAATEPCPSREVAGGHREWRTHYMGFSPIRPDHAQGWMLEGTPHRVLREHFHEVDQFQVVVEGEGQLGRHHVHAGDVHFSRAYTPYGPVVWGDKGMMLLTIRPRPDSKGAHYMPDCREEVTTAARKPYQLSRQAHFSETNADVHVDVLPDMHDDAGLSAHTYTLKPGARTPASDPSRGGGQWILVMKGSLLHEGKSYPAFSIAEVSPDESAFSLHAGADGLNAIVLSFSRPDAQGAHSTNPPRRNTGTRTWLCELCGFVYDEAVGMPDEGVAPGTRWEDVPDTWACPDCSAAKADYKMVEVKLRDFAAARTL